MKFDVKTRVVINGREYGSMAEVPAELREPFEKALAGAEGKQVRTTFVVNGVACETVGGVPAPMRQLVGRVLAEAGREFTDPSEAAGPGPGATAFPGPAALGLPAGGEPASEGLTLRRLLLFGVGAAAAAFLLLRLLAR